MAATRLENLEDMASPSAWEGLERYLGLAIRRRLLDSTNRLQQEGMALQAKFNGARTRNDIESVRQSLEAFRKRYLRTETTLDFYADAVNTRTNPKIAAILRGCDVMARRSMEELLNPLGKTAPPVLTYLDKGLGASILKAGLRLWDQKTESPAAAIKIVRHNLYRPTALIHEAGHQAAYIIGWNEELASALERRLTGVSKKVAEMWGSWASEIAADTFAFAHIGYAAVAGLHDVLAGSKSYVFRYSEFDPHPIAYIRVLLGIEMCRKFFGAGPWDELARAWKLRYPVENAKSDVQNLLRLSVPLLSKVVELCLNTPMRALGGRRLVRLIDPQRVSPESLLGLEKRVGPALFTSQHWVWNKSLRLLALTAFKAATLSNKVEDILNQQKDWMFRLGHYLQAA
jgi:hypothetical protein